MELQRTVANVSVLRSSTCHPCVSGVCRSVSLNTTVPLSSGNIDSSNSAYLFVITNQTHFTIDPASGNVVYSFPLPVPATSTCFQPSLDLDDSTKTWVACTPNHIFAVSITQDGVGAWSDEILSNVTLPMTGSRVPVWQAAPVLTKNGVMQFVLLSGSGAMFAIQGPKPAYPQYQFGPFENVFNVQSPITSLQLLNVFDTEGGILVGAQGTQTLPTSQTPSSIFYTKIPQGTGKWQIQDVNQFGNASYPTAAFSLAYMPQSTRSYVAVALYSAEAPYSSQLTDRRCITVFVASWRSFFCASFLFC